MPPKRGLSQHKVPGSIPGLGFLFVLSPILFSLPNPVSAASLNAAPMTIPSSSLSFVFKHSQMTGTIQTHPSPQMSDSLLQAAYKPGTSTWNTDDPDQQPWLKHRKKKGRNVDDDSSADVAPTGPQPLPFQSSAKLVQRQMTTGEPLLL